MSQPVDNPRGIENFPTMMKVRGQWVCGSVKKSWWFMRFVRYPVLGSTPEWKWIAKWHVLDG